jgi:hypothetical protein
VPTGQRSGPSAIRRTVRDIALSMGVIAAIIAAVMIVTWRPQPDPVREVDALPVAQAAATVTEYPVLFPGVGDGWRATSARFQPTAESGDDPVWFNGWVTPDGEFVAIVQSAARSRDFVVEQTIEGREPRTGGPEVPLAGWTAWISQDGEQRSLVRQTRTGTTIVTGTLDWDDLLGFRDSLSPVQAVAKDGPR